MGAVVRKGCLVWPLDRKAKVGDHLQVGTRRLAFGGEVVAGKDGVGDHQSQWLQAAQMHLAAAGDAYLDVGAVEPVECQDPQAALRRRIEPTPQSRPSARG